MRQQSIVANKVKVYCSLITPYVVISLHLHLLYKTLPMHGHTQTVHLSSPPPPKRKLTQYTIPNPSLQIIEFSLVIHYNLLVR